MIEPLRRSRIVPIEDPLPAAWIRRHPTSADSPEQVGPSLYRVGPSHTLRDALVRTIDSAAEVVALASFLLSDEKVADALVRASEAGKRTYVLTASETRLAAVVREDDEFSTRMMEEHKQLLNRLADHVVLRSAEHFHAKLLVVDPGSRPRGWLSTANFNRALTASVELGVRLEGTAASDLAAWFNWAFWMEAERELAGKGRLAQVGSPPAEPPKPESDVIVATARDESSLHRAVVDLVDRATERILVSSYGLDEDHPAVEALLKRLDAGVPVTLFTRPRPAVLGAIKRLEAAGAEVFGHDKLHAKAIVADGDAMVMTANLQSDGLDRGFELGVRLTGTEASAVARTLEDWSQAFPWRFEPSLPRTQHVGEICLADAGLRTGIRDVQVEDEVTLPAVTAQSALELDSASEPDLAMPREGERLFHRLRFTWEVLPPRLPKKAKPVLREVSRTERDKEGKEKVVRERVPYEPPVFSHGGRKMVVLSDEGSAEAAGRLARELDAQVVIR